MKNRLFVRRVLLTAAITATAGTSASAALGFENGVVQVDYQPGQPGQQTPQGNTTVTQELNRMFQESGQPMPSMLERDLPNANRPTQGQVQIRTTQPPTAQSQNHSAPPKTTSSSGGLLGRFFGKFRGNSAKNDANVKPPVPPEYRPEPSAQATANTMNSQSSPQHRQSAPQGQVSQNRAIQTHNTYNPGQSAAPEQTVSRSATAQAYYDNRPATPSGSSAPQFRNGAVSSLPPRSGASVQPMNVPRSTSNASSGNSAYTQPGSAPGFMAKSGGSAVIQTQPVAAPPSVDEFRNEFVNENAFRPFAGAGPRAAAPAPVLGAAARKLNDGFDSPFVESSESADSTEFLDLDSLIEIPPAMADEPAREATPTRTADALVRPQSIETNTGAAKNQSANSAFDASTESVAIKSAELAEELPEENPFTGVQLGTTDAEFFGSQGSLPPADALTSEGSAMPMEEFDSELPAMDLPPVVNGTSGEDSDGDAAGASAITLNSPETDALNATPPQETVPAANTATAAKPLPESNIPATMNAADTERLRQTAEQERRLNQKRLILARAGQSGFKGFCPVVLRERRELVEVNSLFTSTFGLQTYAFSSAESKAAFDSDPSRYAPAAAGNDVVMLVNSGEEQAGQLDYALWYRDRLYLFRSRETMTLFSEDPQRFASQY